METEIRQYYRRLNHDKYGVTELVALDRHTGRPIATGLFDNEDCFISCCQVFNVSGNIYAGRNPRKGRATNKMDTVEKKRAKDRDIKYLTAISLDIDPIRPKNQPASLEQQQAAVSFALDLQWDLGGDVDDSGNGVYLWFAFRSPILLTSCNQAIIKEQCRVWQEQIKKKYQPERHGLIIDGCYDFSRIKRVIGTVNHKAGRTSRFVGRSEPADEIRNQILAIAIKDQKVVRMDVIPDKELPARFKQLLRTDAEIRNLWHKPDPLHDRSVHDWILGKRCSEAGIHKPEELAVILKKNPHGKFQRDRRMEYVKNTISKLNIQN